MKRNTFEFMVVSKKEGNNLTKGSEGLVLKFYNNDKIWGISKDIFPFVITSTISSFDVFRVFIDGGSSYDIMYSDIFENIELKKDKLWPYEGSDYILSTTL